MPMPSDNAVLAKAINRLADVHQKQFSAIAEALQSIGAHLKYLANGNAENLLDGFEDLDKATQTASSNSLGANIRAARLAAKLTQLVLAHKIGLHGADAGAWISRVESGQQEPRLDSLRRIANALNVTLNALL